MTQVNTRVTETQDIASNTTKADSVPVRRKLKHPKIQSLSFLLRLYNVPMTAQEANRVLIKKGILLSLHRHSLTHNGVVRHFKVLSQKGLAYGANLPNPVHPMETVVHYSIDDFQALAKMLIEEALQ